MWDSIVAWFVNLAGSEVWNFVQVLIDMIKVFLNW